MPFVGTAAVLEPKHVTVRAAPMSATLKKIPLLQTVFHVVGTSPKGKNKRKRARHHQSISPRKYVDLNNLQHAHTEYS